jgi:hypothetical protein
MAKRFIFLLMGRQKDGEKFVFLPMGRQKDGEKVRLSADGASKGWRKVSSFCRWGRRLSADGGAINELVSWVFRTLCLQPINRTNSDQINLLRKR